MRAVLGAFAAAALCGAPLAGQGHPDRARMDSATAAQHGCPMGAGMHGGAMHGGMMGGRDSAGMAGMQHMMGMMAGDSSMIATMRFTPRAVLAHRDLLALTPEQIADIEALTVAAPHTPGDTAHMRQMRQAAADVREVLTEAQRVTVEQLPNPCAMMKGSPADSGTGHR